MLLGPNETDKKAFLLSLIQADPSKISKAITTYGPERFASFEVKDGEISRCGTPLDNLTDTQKELLKKLTPEQVRKLSQKVRINQAEGQIEFLETAR